MSSFEPLALRMHRLFESHDLDETRERISGVMQPHALQPLAAPARRRAHMDFVRLGGVGLGTIAFGEAMRVKVDRLDGYHLLMFCLRGHALATIGSARVDAGPSRGVLLAPEQPFVADFSADCEQLVLRLDSAAVQAHSGLPAPQWHQQLDLRAAALQPVLALLHAVTTTPLLEAAQRHQLVAVDLERLIVHLLLAGQPLLASQLAQPRQPQQPQQPHPARGTPAALPGIAPACVRRAEAFIESQLTLPLRLGDIAQAAGVPVRTLHDAFVRFRGLSPMQRVLEWRLEQARALLLGRGSAARISDVALECGFMHFGRFAQAYRRRFWETPSQTLARLRGMRATKSGN
jgi:AraC-like DNA-binding protein